MKFPDFEYVCPATLSEAVAYLADGDGMARPISGGQSLLPTMAFRLAAPSLLVDLRKIPGLDRIEITEQGVRLGARVRWCDIERDTRLASSHPLLVDAIDHVAHYQIRNRGTVGGSLAHADPSAEMPGVAVACGALITIVGSKGERVVPAAEFFTGTLSTVLADDELVVAVAFPPWATGRRWSFQEFARRQGDFAVAGVALHYDTDANGRLVDTHVGVIGACHSPHRVGAVEALLNGRQIDRDTIAEAKKAMAAAIDPPEDFHASAEYRRSLATTLLDRALTHAATR